MSQVTPEPVREKCVHVCVSLCGCMCACIPVQQCVCLLVHVRVCDRETD